MVDTSLSAVKNPSTFAGSFVFLASFPLSSSSFRLVSFLSLFIAPPAWWWCCWWCSRVFFLVKHFPQSIHLKCLVFPFHSVLPGDGEPFHIERLFYRWCSKFFSVLGEPCWCAALAHHLLNTSCHSDGILHDVVLPHSISHADESGLNAWSKHHT